MIMKTRHRGHPQKQKLFKKVLQKANIRQMDLETIWEDLQTVFSLFQDWLTGTYRKIPLSSIGAISLAFAYFATPLDIIPDFILALGLLDDVTVFILLLGLLRTDLIKYKKWKETEDLRWDPELLSQRPDNSLLPPPTE